MMALPHSGGRDKTTWKKGEGQKVEMGEVVEMVDGMGDGRGKSVWCEDLREIILLRLFAC